MAETLTTITCDDCGAPAVAWGPVIVALAVFDLCEEHVNDLLDFEQTLPEEQRGQELCRIVDGERVHEEYIRG